MDQDYIYAGQSNTATSILIRCQNVQVSLGAVMFVYILWKMTPLQWFKVKSKIKKKSHGQMTKLKKALNYVIYVLFFFCLDLEFTYYLIYGVFTILGYYNPFLCSVLLLDVFKRVPIAQQIIIAVAKPIKSYLGTMLIFLVVSYLFAIVTYFDRWKKVLQCRFSLMTCYIYIVDSTFKQNGGFVSVLSNKSIGTWFVLDFLYVLLMIMFVTQIIAGLIIDTFAQLRERDYNIKESKRQNCFICGLDRQKLDRSGNHRGFDTHVAEDHNLWNYIFYIAYIQSKDETDYNGLESFVKNCLDKNSISWFPIERSLKLEKILEDEKKLIDQEVVEEKIEALTLIYEKLGDIQMKSEANRQKFIEQSNLLKKLLITANVPQIKV